LKEIEQKARSGKPVLRGLSEEDLTSILDEMVIVPPPAKDTLTFEEKKESATEVIIGEGRDVQFPLLLTHAIFLDSVNMARVNKHIRIAMAYGAGIAEVPINAGEGFLLEEKKIAKKFESDMLVQWSPTRIGIDISTLERSKAVIIDLAKQRHFTPFSSDEILERVQGKGGLIDSEILGPAYHLDLDTPDDIKKQVHLIRETTDYKIPIMVKIPPESVYENTKTVLEAEPDGVIIDTSINPFSTLASVNGTFGTTLLGSVAPAKRAIKTLDAKKKGIKLLVSGGFRSGTDIMKILSLGVDAVGISESAIVAMGCDLCGECYIGRCERGLATKDTRLRSNFNWKTGGKKLSNYLKAIKSEMELLMDFIGVTEVKDLNTAHVAALTYDVAAISGVKLIGYDRELPMWFH
jgi:glutamate synthase domain-containing protein 2